MGHARLVNNVGQPPSSEAKHLLLVQSDIHCRWINLRDSLGIKIHRREFLEMECLLVFWVGLRERVHHRAEYRLAKGRRSLKVMDIFTLCLMNYIQLVLELMTKAGRSTSQPGSDVHFNGKLRTEDEEKGNNRSKTIYDYTTPGHAKKEGVHFHHYWKLPVDLGSVFRGIL